MESANYVLHAGASNMASGPDPCIYKNRSICVSNILYILWYQLLADYVCMPKYVNDCILIYVS